MPRSSLPLLCLVATAAFGTPATDPLIGRWVLDVRRTHYGPGAEIRKREVFTCEPISQGVKCTINSVRADGDSLTGTFAAAYDGQPKCTVGIPGVDQVSLRKIDEFVADATFLYNRQPVFAYRAIRS